MKEAHFVLTDENLQKKKGDKLQRRISLRYWIWGGGYNRAKKKL